VAVGGSFAGAPAHAQNLATRNLERETSAAALISSL